MSSEEEKFSFRWTLSLDQQSFSCIWLTLCLNILPPKAMASKFLGFVFQETNSYLSHSLRVRYFIKSLKPSNLISLNFPLLHLRLSPTIPFPSLLFSRRASCHYNGSPFPRACPSVLLHVGGILFHCYLPSLLILWITFGSLALPPLPISMSKFCNVS